MEAIKSIQQPSSQTVCLSWCGILVYKKCTQAASLQTYSQHNSI